MNIQKVIILLILNCKLVLTLSDVLHSYSASNYNFEVLDDKLFLVNNDIIEVWNSTTKELIDSVRTKFPSKLRELFTSITLDYLYVFMPGGSCFYEYQISDFMKSRQHCLTDEGIADMKVNKNYIYILHSQTTSANKRLQILNRESFSLVEKVPLTRVSYLDVDEEGVYFVVVGEDKYTVNKISSSGNWSISIPNFSFTVASYAQGPFTFVATQNLIYQLDRQNGRILREIPISDFTLRSLVFYKSVVFLYMINSQIFEIFAESAKLRYIYDTDDFSYPFGQVKISNNFFFQSNINSRDTADICVRSMKIVQRKLDDPTNLYSYYNYDKRRSSERPSVKIVHKDTPVRDVINSATITKRYKNIQKLMSQNSFFSPVFLPYGRDNGLFLYFSGSGSCEKNLCERNSIRFINISTFSTEDKEIVPIFDDNYANIFATVNTKLCCGLTCFLPDEKQVLAYSSLHDYASILLHDEVFSYYVIHAGCPCYSRDVTSNAFMVQIQNQEFVYVEASQSIPLA
jgi:hypothetical protein